LLVLTEDQRVVMARLPVEKGCVRDDKTQEAWVLWHESLVRRENSNESYLVVSERDVAPLCLNGNSSASKDITKLVNAIAAESRERAHFNLEKQNRKDKLAEILQVLILGGAVVAVIVIIAGLVLSGRFHLPF